MSISFSIWASAKLDLITENIQRLTTYSGLSNEAKKELLKALHHCNQTKNKINESSNVTDIIKEFS